MRYSSRELQLGVFAKLSFVSALQFHCLRLQPTQISFLALNVSKLLLVDLGDVREQPLQLHQFRLYGHQILWVCFNELSVGLLVQIFEVLDRFLLCSLFSSFRLQFNFDIDNDIGVIHLFWDSKLHELFDNGNKLVNLGDSFGIVSGGLQLSNLERLLIN